MHDTLKSQATVCYVGKDESFLFLAVNAKLGCRFSSQTFLDYVTDVVVLALNGLLLSRRVFPAYAPSKDNISLLMLQLETNAFKILLPECHCILMSFTQYV